MLKPAHIYRVVGVVLIGTRRIPINVAIPSSSPAAAAADVLYLADYPRTATGARWETEPLVEALSDNCL